MERDRNRTWIIGVFKGVYSALPSSRSVPGAILCEGPQSFELVFEDRCKEDIERGAEAGKVLKPKGNMLADVGSMGRSGEEVEEVMEGKWIAVLFSRFARQD